MPHHSWVLVIQSITNFFPHTKEPHSLMKNPFLKASKSLFNPALHLQLSVITELDLLDEILQGSWPLICIHWLKSISWGEHAVPTSHSHNTEHR